MNFKCENEVQELKKKSWWQKLTKSWEDFMGIKIAGPDDGTRPSQNLLCYDVIL